MATVDEIMAAVERYGHAREASCLTSGAGHKLAQEHLSIIRAMLAPVAPDPGLREAIAKAVARPRNHRFTINQGEPTIFDYERADAVMAVLAERGVR